MKILLLLSLCLFSACNGSSGSSSNKSSPPIVVIEPEPEIPVIEEPEVLSIIFDSIPNLTKNLNINIKANVSENLAILKIYKEETCSISPVTLTKAQLQAGSSFSLSANIENILYYKALDVNNFESVMCQEFKRVVHDSISPEPLLGSYLFSQNGLNTSELSFLTGGESLDISLDSALFNYYRREGSEFIFVGSGTRSVYLAKQITVQLKENEINNIYLKIIDNAGNESDYSSNGIFINQTTSVGTLPKPILYSDLENINFKTTNLNKVNIKGIVSFQTQAVQVYSEVLGQ